MPATEKELNVYLLNQLDLIEDAIEVAEEEKAEKTLKLLHKQKERIERKLY